MPSSSTIVFAVPPSLGAVRATTAASKLGSALRRLFAPERSVRMAVPSSYEQLSADLLDSRVDVAWAPALVCARVERAGGRALLRISRGGAETYRAAFVCSADRPVDLANLHQVRVAWVDPQSAGGYLIPRGYLLGQGVDPAVAFKEEVFAGSYNAALVALLSGKAELTTTFASSAQAQAPSTGLDSAPPELRSQLRVVGYSAEIPNDGIIASPALTPALADWLRDKLASVEGGPAEVQALLSVFDADRLVPAPPRAYQALYGLVPPGGR